MTLAWVPFSLSFPFSWARAWRALAALAVSVVMVATAGAVDLTPPAPAAASDGPPAVAGAGGAGAGMVRVVVQGRGAAPGTAADSVERLGGVVTRHLPIVGGVAGTVHTAALPALSATPGLIVTPDRPVQVQAAKPASSATSIESAYRRVVGADTLNSAGHTGQGVTVAVVDTGISEVPDLAGRLVPVRDDVKNTTSPCLNLSGEATCGDSYGHGTFMAGIIAGSGASSRGAYRGMAPAARLVSVKIAGQDGSADVSTVLAAIQWVVSFREQYGIRVLNLSLGTDSTQSYRTDPLNYAVERAWDSGIAVVVAAANLGPGAATISKPGDDPWVITVGAVDDRGTTKLGDDHLPDFSSRGPTAADGLAKPDVAAPGAHVVSLNVADSSVNRVYPTSMKNGYRKGSGTSMAAAVVSGAAALLIDADPAITPNRLKYALTATAAPTASDDRMEVGAGILQAAAALAAPAGEANAGLERSNGMGALDASRGTVLVRTLSTDPLGTGTGTVITGTQTAQLLAWDPVGFTTGDWSQTSWYTSSFYLSGWQAVTWEGSRWHGSRWHGSRWHGVEDTTTTYGSRWHGSDWYGAWE